jgi:surface polysaccharide O-acyltransferase-like enzyme
MNKILSSKISFFSFWLIVMVVLLHSTVGVEEYTSSTSKFGALQRYISFGLCQIAVPFFFIISGYLFFFRTYKKT